MYAVVIVGKFFLCLLFSFANQKSEKCDHNHQEEKERKLKIMLMNNYKRAERIPLAKHGNKSLLTVKKYKENCYYPCIVSSASSRTTTTSGWLATIIISLSLSLHGS